MVQPLPCAECDKNTEHDEMDALYIDDYGPFCIVCYAKGIKNMNFVSDEVRDICQGAKDEI